MDLNFETDLPTKSLRILIVDDDPGVRKLLKELAERWHCKPLVTGRASDAFDAIRNNEADLMLLDIQMPIVGGIQLLSAMKRYSLSLPTVVISAYVSPQILEEVKVLGVDHVLCKPFTVGRLKKEINHVLKDQELETEAVVG